MVSYNLYTLLYRVKHMTISIGARLDESLVEEMDSLIDSSSEYKDRTQVITLALEKFLEEKGAIQNERKSRKPIP